MSAARRGGAATGAGKEAPPIERLEQIETKIAYLEHANAQLSEVLLLQERDIDALRNQLAVLQSRLDAGKGGESPWTVDDERPPHY